MLRLNKGDMDTWDQGVGLVAHAWAELNETPHKIAEAFIGLTLLASMTGEPSKSFIFAGTACIAALCGRDDKEQEVTQALKRSYN